MTTISEFRSQFPVTRQHIYLNHAAVSPLPLACSRAMQAYLTELGDHGAAHYPDLLVEQLGTVRNLGARLLHTRPESVFVVRSTTQGLGLVATGLPFQQGDNLVLVEREFPANLRPWMPLKRRGVELRLVPQRSGRVRMDDLAAAVDRRTRALSVSFVQFLSAFRIDLAAVAELCRQHDTLFVVDAIQGLGAFDLDVEASGVDFLAADAHKWLLGPEGVGLGYASPRALQRIEPALEGWLSVQRPFDFFDLDQPLKESAARFEEGAFNTAGLFGLAGSLRLLLETGIPVISRRILDLTDRVANGLEALGWQVRSPRESTAEKSGIVLTDKPGVDIQALTGRLKQQRIVVSIRDGALRIAPHAYNTSDEIEQLLKVLSASDSD